MGRRLSKAKQRAIDAVPTLTKEQATGRQPYRQPPKPTEGSLLPMGAIVGIAAGLFGRRRKPYDRCAVCKGEKSLNEMVRRTGEAGGGYVCFDCIEERARANTCPKTAWKSPTREEFVADLQAMKEKMARTGIPVPEFPKWHELSPEDQQLATRCGAGGCSVCGTVFALTDLTTDASSVRVCEQCRRM